MAPRFSVLLPTSNRAELLRLAILSVLAQTEEDFELLVAGDGCTDHSAAVVASFDDKRIRWFDLPKAPYFGYANRNVALKQSVGQYIAFVADDDLIFPDHLELLAASIEQSGAEWVYNRPLWVTTDGIVVPFAKNLLNSDELEIFLTLHNHIPASCVLYRRICLAKYGYWPEDVPRAADWRYWVRIIEGGNRTNLNYCPTPTALHFNASWKTTPNTQMSQVTAARELAAKSSWWPASLKIPIAPNVPEQKALYELIQSKGYVDQLRRDVTRVVERLAWMQLNDTPAEIMAMAAHIAGMRDRLGTTESRLGDTESRLGNTQNQLGDALNRLGDAQNRLSDTQRRLDDAQNRLSDAQFRLDAVENRLNAAQSRLEAIFASTSWRLTAPLREAMDAIRRKGK